ncbi:MAG TPA: DUF1080 domain-containing protein [Bryobacteraceae bacterium]|nr:DUF1080 domain-containing protein [Bryobacteraceae bacterium]
MKIARLALFLLPFACFADDWPSLFDGKTLHGWQVKAKPADRAPDYWTVRDGAITCDSLGRKNHDYVWLVSDGEYGDFHLTSKVRGFKESPGNSGIQVRSRYDQSTLWLDGPQMDIHPPAPWRTGLIYDETRGVQRWIFPSLPDWDIKETDAPGRWTWNGENTAGGWNTVEIICQGTRIVTRLNGTIRVDFDGAGILDDNIHRSRNVGLKGHIALQLHVKDELLIQFKDIRIKPM